MPPRAHAILYLDQFEVTETNKKFEKVTRLSCRLGEEGGYEMHLDLDVNTELYPLVVRDRFTFALASTLALDGSIDEAVYDQSGKPSLIDQYDYCMHGTIFKLHQSDPKRPIEAHLSCGGLLVRIKGDAAHLKGLALYTKIYILMRKITAAA
jgi:DNA-directed RNA polymerase I, II, and III subunit RPABC3